MVKQREMHTQEDTWRENGKPKAWRQRSRERKNGTGKERQRTTETGNGVTALGRGEERWWEGGKGTADRPMVA